MYMEVAIATWLFIGLIFGVMLPLALLCGRSRSGLVRDRQGVEPDEDRRRTDAVAADAARMAGARMPPFQGGYPI
jgi:hypothetical protein